jgi:hypothetical protein
MTGHQIHLNAVDCLSECAHSNAGFSHQEMSSKLVNVTMWEHCTFDCEILDVAKFTTLTP